MNSKSSSPFLFTSERLGFRSWTHEDVPAMAAINADPQVMEFFPATQSTEQTAAFITRAQQMYEKRSYCYFAVETLAQQEFIGFTGLAWQEYEAPFTPCTDIGWRLKKAAWGRGYATEGAVRCLRYAFEILNLENIVATAPVINTRSIQVMKKIGMQPLQVFDHPALMACERLRSCVCYRSSKK